MSSAIFRQIALGGERHKSERLFRAAVSAFCALTRPSRLEIAQLDDLALPLFGSVSVEARRFAAAALSECRSGPPQLVRLLCNEPVSTAAPLLMRSTALRDVDLVVLIGRHGLPHARAIARRKNLNPAIAALIRKLLAGSDTSPGGATVIPLCPPKPADAAQSQEDDAEERVREQLRTMMRPAFDRVVSDRGGGAWATAGAYHRLRSSVLRGTVDGLPQSLSTVLGLPAERARQLMDDVPQSGLLTALRALDLKVEEAFLIAALAVPGYFGTAQSIRMFLDGFAAMPLNKARDLVDTWRAGETAAR